MLSMLFLPLTVSAAALNIELKPSVARFTNSFDLVEHSDKAFVCPAIISIGACPAPGHNGNSCLGTVCADAGVDVVGVL